MDGTRVRLCGGLVAMALVFVLSGCAQGTGTGVRTTSVGASVDLSASSGRSGSATIVFGR